MPIVSGGLMSQGGLVQTIGQPTTFVFGWGGTAPTSTPATLSSFATAWAAATAYTVGAVVKGADGRAYGCTKAGTSAASPATGPSGAGGTGTPAVLLCGVNLQTILDGTACWLPLSGPAIIQAAFVTNRGSAFIDVSSLATVAAGAGAGIAPAGSWQLDGCAPELYYVIAGSGIAFGVSVAV